MSDTHETGHGHGHGTSHPAVEIIRHPTPLLYWKTYWFLMVALVVTVLLYWVDLSVKFGWVGWNIVIAMVVALAKAYVVIRNFMNVGGGTKLILLWAVLGFLWFILLFGVFLDYRTRPEPAGWQEFTH